MIRLAACLALLLLALPLPAGAKTAKDCEKIQNPMEFNLCLASLSPVRGSPEARARRRMAAPPGEMGQQRRARVSGRPTAAQPNRIKLPEGALQVVNGRVRLAITPR